MPRQLPLAIKDFTGRAEHVAALDALLPAEENGGAGGAVVISAVDGTAGIGKTTLAVWWAHRVQSRFPDGTLYVNLRGYGAGDPATPGEVLEGFLRALGLRAEEIPVGVEALAGSFRSVLAGRRMLIVLDNANNADQVRPLLPGTPGCVVVVTSRESLTGLVVTEAATRLSLDLLSDEEAVTLVSSILGPACAAAEPDAIRELVRYCARLPLALRIAASRAATPHITVGDVVTELADDRFRLDALSQDGDERAAVRAVFDWSYRRLPAEQARAFRRLGLHPGEEFGVEAAAAVCELDLSEARWTLAALARAHLIEPAAGGRRYRFHDLLRAYAADRVKRDDPPDERERARRVLLMWYAHHAKTALQILFPAHRDWDPALRLTTQARPEIQLSGREETWAWTDLEVDNLVASTRDADQHDETPLTLILVTTTAMILHRRGRWDDLFDLYSRGLRAARRSDDRLAEVEVQINLGETLQLLGQWRDAEGVLQVALEMARGLKDPWREAAALLQLGSGCVALKQFAQAQNYLLAASPLAPGAQNGRVEAYIEWVSSRVFSGLGDYQAALHHGHRSVAFFQQAGDREGEVGCLRGMAIIHHSLGDHQMAIELCEQAIRIVSRQFFPTAVARVLGTLGVVLRDIGDTARAIGCWREALKIYEDCSPEEVALDDLRELLHALEAAVGADPNLEDR
ncbi:tetratricopeptide repeat protein [Amycolatopsis sp. NPDC024027]|uniref:ATP-binding protein n=1 Tax=Amycolatopsis sp. NPDC024027 TaxID=3154327 RepID=UPI003408FCC3